VGFVQDLFPVEVFLEVIGCRMVVYEAFWVMQNFGAAQIACPSFAKEGGCRPVGVGLGEFLTEAEFGSLVD
jgi:hypothetical protein